MADRGGRKRRRHSILRFVAPGTNLGRECHGNLGNPGSPRSSIQRCAPCAPFGEPWVRSIEGTAAVRSPGICSPTPYPSIGCGSQPVELGAKLPSRNHFRRDLIRSTDRRACPGDFRHRHGAKPRTSVRVRPLRSLTSAGTTSPCPAGDPAGARDRVPTDRRVASLDAARARRCSTTAGGCRSTCSSESRCTGRHRWSRNPPDRGRMDLHQWLG
jgi:hypothetical protein